MHSSLRYLRLLGAFARYGLAREMAFRGNFLINICVEVLWLFVLLFFYGIVFTKTSMVGGWTEPEYLFFLGCYFALEGVMETFFLGNCSQFADLIRSGDLDFYLLKPIDEQFLVTFRNIEWSSVPSIFMGAGVMVVALSRLGQSVDAATVALFILLFACGAAIAYSFLLFLTSASVWLTRNQSLYELWWLLTSLMRYPSEVFTETWFYPVSRVFTFIIPVMLIVNVPARVMVKAFEPGMIAFTLAATVVLVFASRKFFRFALQKYRSASS